MRPSLLPSLRSSLSPRPLLFDHVFALACKHLRTHSLTDAPAGMAGGLELLECGLKAFETALFKTKLSLLSLRLLSLRALGLSSFCSVERGGGTEGGGEGLEGACRHGICVHRDRHGIHVAQM